MVRDTTRRRVLQLTGGALLIGFGSASASAQDDEVIEPETRIELDAQTSGWVGIEPEAIADEDNPTLTLQEDETYEIGWEEGDGASHNIELVDENDEVVDDYETEEATEGGEDQFIEFDATDEIVEYVCRVHPNTMRGEIEIE
ncbi:cupredoxin domain-containing protein [Natrialba asiatica]|uniref:Blue (Type 1) copper domain-containing protein n=1 Tax=Natrialba asiatica (strain ATCC 700177 / DSM 12278 / JCM 9576 / FERM P-10747 / NBRC 102637 / 172P1) TaxID=29540 RepID=M0AW66_NATA1|nr:plastocyanin/azurin family copper-binding protein [Natrialba asiatica]ELZ02790.1 blue (type 1) copper domain-containing protein [Natrialba asiatica DSM 12278]